MPHLQVVMCCHLILKSMGPLLITCLMEDEYHLFMTHSTCKVIREKYGNLLDGQDNVNVTHKCPPRMVSTKLACIIFT